MRLAAAPLGLDHGTGSDRGGADAASRQGQEPRGERLHPKLCRAEAPEARPPPARADGGRDRARGRAQPVDRRVAGRRGDRPPQGTHAARARDRPRHEGRDRPALRQARPPGPGPPRQARRRPKAFRGTNTCGAGRVGDHRELVGLFRRKQETLNEQLLREAGLDSGQMLGAAPPPPPPQPVEPPKSALAKAGVVDGSGVGPKEWDVAITVTAPALAGDRVTFTTIPDGDVIVDEESGNADLTVLADAVERSVSPPYRAVGQRQDGDFW